jgi:hypothetical protein
MTVAQAAWVERDGLLRSPLLDSLGLVAGFTTRALGSDASAVAARLGFPAVVRVRQVHGDRVVQAAGLLEPPPEADALWTERRGVLLGVAGADCPSVLVAEPDGVIGAAHAGWQGTTKRVARSLVTAVVAHGARPERLVAAIGPGIGPCCYTVDPSRAALIRERLGDRFIASASAVSAGVPGGPRYTFDLWAANADQLAVAGVRSVELAGLCTRCGGADLWSHRGHGPGHGAGLGLIGRPR